MRFLGIDYGKKRIGLSLSDENGKFAFPMKIILNNKEVFSFLSKIIKENKITEIVIGESLDFDGMPNKVMKEIEKFSSELEKSFLIPVHFQKEFLTSVEARRYKENKEKVDSNASALILQRYLDRINK
ncbi:MAG: Holliday junction resolvase RuvX [Candidatus Paceibacterota bacterium]|jgi:putative Holliday junction resolvase